MNLEDKRIAFIENALPNLAIKQLQSITSGWDNDIFIINQELVFRFPKTNKIAANVLRESLLLEKLHKKNPVIAIPHYHHLLNENGQLVCVYYPYMNGLPLNEVDPFSNRKENATLLGKFLTALHRLGKLTELTSNHTYNFWQDLYTSLTTEVFPYLNTYQQDEINETFTSFLDHFSAYSKVTTVIHGDLSATNMIFDPRTEKISGVIDFTDAHIGDPAYDFAGFYRDFGPDFTWQVLEHYQGTEPKEAIFIRVKSFYGIQPIFHQLLHAVREKKDMNWETALSKFLQLKKA